MVAAIFIFTLLLFIVVDLILRKEDRTIYKTEKSRKTPIFQSPERALRKIANETNRLYHLSHSWVVSAFENHFYVGFDKFIPTIFPSDIKIKVIPKIDSYIQQGAKIWDIYFNGRKITQLAPISGMVVDINPSCRMKLNLPADQVEKSWIVKMKAASYSNESNNLMNHSQATYLNNGLRDKLVLDAQHGNYLNDGGKIDPSYLVNMSDDEWNSFIEKFFPYSKSIND